MLVHRKSPGQVFSIEVFVVEALLSFSSNQLFSLLQHQLYDCPHRIAQHLIFQDRNLDCLLDFAATVVDLALQH